MTAREALARLIYEDPGMAGLGFTASRVWMANSLDTPETDAPFIVIKADLEEKAFGNVGVDIVSYWVHTPRSKVRDYATIDAAIDRLKMLMGEVAHLAGSDGWILTAGTWVDTSRDLIDEAYNSNVRYATFRTATRSIVS